MTARAQPVRVSDGTDVVIVQAYESMWHLPAKGDEQLARRTLCGLEGLVYSAAVTGGRKPCQVCVGRAPKGVVVRVRPKGRKRRSAACKISEPQLRALHHLHWEQRVPINELGRRYWERFGYKSAPACANTISHHFRTRGWQTHDRIAMTVAASTKNGLSPRDWQQRKSRRAAAGLTQKGKERQPLCGRCGKPAQRGSDFCFSHDPSRKAERAAATARMRERSPLHNRTDLEDAASLVAALNSYRESGGRWSDLARASGVSQHWIAHVAVGNQARVAQSRAAAIREALK
jgi:hypothetical protein